MKLWSDRDSKAFQEELEQFVPSNVLDFQAHIYSEDVLPSSMEQVRGAYSIEQLEADMGLAFPGRKIAAVCVGMPAPGFDHGVNNAYVAKACEGTPCYPLMLFDPDDQDQEAVCERLVEGRFVGIMPHATVRAGAGPDELLPEWLLESVNEAGRLVVLDVCTDEQVVRDQLIDVCQAYPGAKFILARAGRPRAIKTAAKNMDEMRMLPNLFFNTAMVTHWELLECLFALVDSHKILYASGLPEAFAPGKTVLIDDHFHELTPSDLPAGHLSPDFVPFLYEELRAIKVAVERLGFPRDSCLDLFYDNGMRLLKAVARPCSSR